MEKHIDLAEGDTLVVRAIPSEPPLTPVEPPVDDLQVLLRIGGIPIYTNAIRSYVCFRSDLDICNDGSGPSHGDSTYQSMTAYYNGGKYLNADKDKYIVIPPQIRSMVPGVVMGCKARLTNLENEIWTPAVTGDIGPDDKTGEAAYCAARVVNPDISHNSGDKKTNYFYELWPDVPAVVDGHTYKLEAA